MKLSCSEIEARAAAELTDRRHELLSSRVTTSVDLLQIQDLPQPEVVWEEDLNHDSLLRLVGPADSRTESIIPTLRVLFFGMACTHPDTLDWLQDRFAVSALFLDCVSDTDYRACWKAGNVSFLRRDQQGKVANIEGIYMYPGGFIEFTYVWFSYNLSARSTTYLLANCPDHAKKRIERYAHDQTPRLLSRPFAVDVCIADACASAWLKELLVPRNVLFHYEHHGASQLPSPAHAFEDLHSISQQFHIISAHLTNFGGCLEFLLDTHRRYSAVSAEFQPGETAPWTTPDTSVEESLTFLTSRNRTWMQWVANFTERTNIRINLFFNLESQNANRTNLEIANLTSKIAIETQQDSSAMITMAAVTMFFLPGTFVSAVFGMVFFSGTDENGRAEFIVSPRWWYYPVITIPLTILVFIIWAVWQRQREASRGLAKPARMNQTPLE